MSESINKKISILINLLDIPKWVKWVILKQNGELLGYELEPIINKFEKGKYFQTSFTPKTLVLATTNVKHSHDRFYEVSKKRPSKLEHWLGGTTYDETLKMCIAKEEGKHVKMKDVILN